MTGNGKKSKEEVAGYKGHKPGSRKGTIHELFDKEGAEVAWTRGLKMKLKESSLRSWFSRWGYKKPSIKVSKPVAAKPEVKPKAVKKSAKGRQGQGGSAGDGETGWCRRRCLIQKLIDCNLGPATRSLLFTRTIAGTLPGTGKQTRPGHRLHLDPRILSYERHEVLHQRHRPLFRVGYGDGHEHPDAHWSYSKQKTKRYVLNYSVSAQGQAERLAI
jgi:hypothetical protein